MERTLDAECDYVLLSDVHLGSDLVQHARPWSRDSWLREHAEIDARIESMIAYHLQRAAGRIRFVIAGDFVDFIGMSLPLPPSTLRSGATDEERAHGLGSAGDHAAHKVQAMAARHERVLRALSTALLAGHVLVLVPGNHDMEWHWPAARRAFREELRKAAPELTRERLNRQVEFHPWFYHVPGLLYVEHGHEFDPMCSYGDPVLPLCPKDPRRIRTTPSSVLLRYVARPTRGLSTFGHEHANFLSYLRIASGFGLLGGLKLSARFVRASYRLLRDARLRCARLEHRSARRLRALARATRLSAELLERLKRQHVRPVMHSHLSLLCSLYLDRVLLVMFVVAACAVALASTPCRAAIEWSLGAALAALAAGALTGRRRNIDPTAAMREGARRAALHLGVRYVVMGHTHEPRFDALEEGGSYVNLGHWGQDELPEDRDAMHGSPISSYLHLVRRGDGYQAALCAWDPVAGPRLLACDGATVAAGVAVEGPPVRSYPPLAADDGVRGALSFANG